MTMVTISVRTPGVPGAGGGNGAVVDALGPVGSTSVLKRQMYSTDWHLQPDGIVEDKPRRLEKLSEVATEVGAILGEASRRGLHVTYRGQSGPIHEFWPATALPIVTVT